MVDDLPNHIPSTNPSSVLSLENPTFTEIPEVESKRSGIKNEQSQRRADETASQRGEQIFYSNPYYLLISKFREVRTGALHFCT